MLHGLSVVGEMSSLVALHNASHYDAYYNVIDCALLFLLYHSNELKISVLRW